MRWKQDNSEERGEKDDGEDKVKGTEVKEGRRRRERKERK